MGILPVALFAGGHTYFAQRMAERMGLEPYAVHATFQFSGTPGKRHRLRERLVGTCSACPLAIKNIMEVRFIALVATLLLPGYCQSRN